MQYTLELFVCAKIRYNPLMSIIRKEKWEKYVAIQGATVLGEIILRTA